MYKVETFFHLTCESYQVVKETKKYKTYVGQSLRTKEEAQTKADELNRVKK